VVLKLIDCIINILVNMFLELQFSVNIRTNVEQLYNYSMTIQSVCINNMSLFYKQLYLLLNDTVFCDKNDILIIHKD